MRPWPRMICQALQSSSSLPEQPSSFPPAHAASESHTKAVRRAFSLTRGLLSGFSVRDRTRGMALCLPLYARCERACGPETDDRDQGSQCKDAAAPHVEVQCQMPQPSLQYVSFYSPRGDLPATELQLCKGCTGAMQPGCICRKPEKWPQHSWWAAASWLKNG